MCIVRIFIVIRHKPTILPRDIQENENKCHYFLYRKVHDAMWMHSHYSVIFSRRSCIRRLEYVQNIKPWGKKTSHCVKFWSYSLQPLHSFFYDLLAMASTQKKTWCKMLISSMSFLDQSVYLIKEKNISYLRKLKWKWSIQFVNKYVLIIPLFNKKQYLTDKRYYRDVKQLKNNMISSLNSLVSHWGQFSRPLFDWLVGPM